MEFKHNDIEVIDEDNIIVWVKGDKVQFNLKKGQLRKDLVGMGVISTDDEFEAYLVRAANEYIIKGLHKVKRKKWIYDKSDDLTDLTI